MTPEDTQSPNRFFLLCLSTAIISCIVTIFAFIFIFELTPLYFIKKLLTTLYRPHYNHCFAGTLEGNNIFLYIYGIIIITSACVFCLRKKLFRPQFPIPVSSILKYVTCSVFCIVLTLQTVNQAIYFAFERQKYSQKSTGEKLPTQLSILSDSAAYFQSILPGKHSADFISDLDISRDPGMLIYSAFAYYLYPIDIRDIRREPKDILIVLEKNDPLKSIPDDYIIIGNIDQKYFLARKSGGSE